MIAILVAPVILLTLGTNHETLLFLTLIAINIATGAQTVVRLLLILACQVAGAKLLLFGFNLLADFTIPGIGDIQGLEDFIVSNNLLPLGSLVFLLFCVTKKGWGWKGFIAEADAGEGPKFPKWARGWVTFGIPVLIIFILVMGYVPIVTVWIGG